MDIGAQVRIIEVEDEGWERVEQPEKRPLEVLAELIEAAQAVPIGEPAGDGPSG